MNIFLKTLGIVNFKGISQLQISFDSETNIYGENATGKTSIFDAFTWLLFGKDSNDSATFNIKPLDKDGRAFQRTESEVSATLDVDGRKMTLKKVYKEKWVKNRGKKEAEFEGNENLFYWNDVPLLQKDYQAKISDLVNEGLFKMITNTLYFNQQMKWGDRRNVLMSIAGTITNEDIASGHPEYDELIEVLTNKSLIEYKKEISAKKKKLKDDLTAIPTRVDEAHRSLPEVPNYLQISADIADQERLLDGIEQAMSNNADAHKVVFERIKAQLKEIHNLTVKRDQISYDIKAEESQAANKSASQMKSKRREIEELERALKIATEESLRLAGQKESIEKQVSSLREKWNRVNAETVTFNDNDFHCPTCKREFESGDVEAKKLELQNNFNNDKRSRLAKITEDGHRYSKDKAYCEERTAELALSKESLLEQLDVLNEEMQQLNEANSKPRPALASILEYKPRYAEIAQLNDQIAALEASKETEPKIDNGALISERAIIRTKLDGLKRQLSVKDQIEKTTARINDLLAEEQNLAQQLADLEGTEFLIEKFTKAKIDTMEERINGRFSIVSFKLFNTLINGSVEECCETMVNGVPFPDLNTASKINAGIDIINVLCEHYNVHAPIFIDGRESVTNVIPCDSQVINLIVREGSPLTVDGQVVGARKSKELAA